MLKIENPRKRIAAGLLNLCLKIILWPATIFSMSRRFPKATCPKRILVIRLDNMGDVIMSTGVFRQLKKRYPEAKITGLVGAWGEPVLRNNPNVAEVIVHNCPWFNPQGRKNYIGWFFRDYPAVLRRIRSGRFDLGIDLRSDFRHILFFLFWGGAKYRFGHDRSGGEFLLNEKIPYPDFVHEIEKNFQILEPLGIKNLSFEEKRPEFFLRGQERSKIAGIFAKFSVSEGDLKIVIHPGAANILRRWPTEYFGEVANWLIDVCQAKVFAVGGPAERELGVRLSGLTQGRVINLAGRLTLSETAALIEKSSLFLGNDSALGHLAACFDVPILILFGPNNPVRCAPHSPLLSCLYHQFSCSPCLQIYCRFKDTDGGRCLRDIKTEEVTGKITEIWKRTIKK